MNKKENILSWSATKIANAIREGQFTAVNALEAHLHKIDEVNPSLNAVIFDRRKEALKEAQAADKRIAEAKQNNFLNELPPLLGVPCTIKENFAFAGTPQASGLLARAHIINDHDAPTVERIRKAGAIPMGVTNTSELCMWMESYNKVYGMTNNPYDVTRTVGGSSGGEGAIIGSGASPFGLGSDVGGSIRMPAFFNGVFGHKPSPLLIPNEGQYPVAQGEANRILSTGPLCRKAEDLALLVKVLAGDQAHRLKDPLAVDISKLRVMTLEPERGPRMSADQKNALKRAVKSLENKGAKFEAIDLPAMDKAFDIWSAMLAEADSENSFAEMMFGTKNPLRGAAELFRFMVGLSPHTLPLIILATAERISELTPQRHKKLVQMGEDLKARLHELLGEDGVLIHPPYPTVAPKHYKALFPPFNFVHCAIFNTMQMPATCVPMGLNKQGIPTGIQVIAAPENDHLGIACALVLEEDCGGWVKP
jgi:fatty acid amide hydrolase 2